VDGTCLSGTCVGDSLPNTTICWPDTLFGFPGVVAKCHFTNCSNGSCPTDVQLTETDCSRLPGLLPYCSDDSGGQCDEGTGKCFFADGTICDPTSGTTTCNFTQLPLASGVRTCNNPSQCCPGQGCICTPTALGVPLVCDTMYCYNPQDIANPNPIP
jgi:hypothetical protein